MQTRFGLITIHGTNQLADVAQDLQMGYTAPTSARMHHVHERHSGRLEPAQRFAL